MKRTFTKPYQFVLFLLIVFSSDVYAQEMVVRGKVLIAFNPELILPYDNAHVRIKGKGIGTLTNNDGEFILNIPKQFINDTLIISHSSYDTTNLIFSTAINELDTNAELVLEITNSSVWELSYNYNYDFELDGYQILKKAFEMILQNHCTAYAGQIFYQEDLLEHAILSSTLIYTKGVAELYVKGNTGKVVLIKGKQLKDTVNINSFYIPNEYEHNIQKSLDIDFVKDNHTFNLEKIKNNIGKVAVSIINGRYVYIVSFTDHTNFYKKPYNEYIFMVDSESFAILSVEHVYYWNDRKYDRKSKLLKTQGYDFLKHRTSSKTRYQFIDGKWYPAYATTYYESTLRVNEKLVKQLHEEQWVENGIAFFIYGSSSTILFTSIKPLQQVPFIQQTDSSFETNTFKDEFNWGDYNYIKADELFYWIEESIYKRNNKIEGW